MEEEAKLACQAELLLAKVVLDQTANRLQEVEHLEWGAGELVRETGWGGSWEIEGGAFCELLDTERDSSEAVVLTEETAV